MAFEGRAAEPCPRPSSAPHPEWPLHPAAVLLSHLGRLLSSLTKIRRCHRGPSGPVGHGRWPPPPTLLPTRTPSGGPASPPLSSLLSRFRPAHGQAGRLCCALPLLGTRSRPLLPGPLRHRRQIPAADTCSRHTVTQHALHTARRQPGTLPTAAPRRGSPSHPQHGHRRKRPVRPLWKRGK